VHPSLSQQLLQHLEAQGFLRAGERVGVAVSGGADSVALLHLLLELREKLGIVLSVAHFNHKLRGRASDADERFVAKLAAKHGLAFHLEQADIAAKAKREKTNLEEAARRARYAFFTRLVKEAHVDRVAVAHTADDQAETVLAHILRGTGLAGLGGIHPVAGAVFRPLLGIRRAALRKYLRARKQSWREDASNLDTARMRARIRKKLLPLLEKQFQPAVVEHLTTLAELAREDEAFLEALLEARMAKIVQRRAGEIRIAVGDLLETGAKKGFNVEFTETKESSARMNRSTAMSKRIVRRIVEEVKRRPGELGARHVEAVLDLARSGQSGKALQLPGGIEVRREQDALVFCAPGTAEEKAAGKPPPQFEYSIDPSAGSQDVRVPELGCVFRFRVIDWPSARGETKERAALDRDRLRLPLVLRNRRPGDRMRPLGHRNAHKLKRLLNEKRVSRWERGGWPVLTSGGVVAWARGLPVAAEFAAGERARAAIVIAEEAL